MEGEGERDGIQSAGIGSHFERGDAEEIVGGVADVGEGVRSGDADTGVCGGDVEGCG